MVRKASLCTLFLGLAVSLPAMADGLLARFDGGIGAQPFARDAQNQLVDNDVLNVRPGGRPWVIERLRTDVKTDGRISVDGRGLLFAGSANVGRTGGQMVQARLYCGGVPHNTQLVPLEANGDFRIDGVLTPVPPSPCTNAILLIVNAGGVWFAAGIPKD